MTTSPVMHNTRLTKRGRVVARLAAVFLAAALAMVIETAFVTTGVPAFDHLMLALNAIITLELLLAALLIDDLVKFTLTASFIFGVVTVGSMAVYGAFG